MVCSYVLSFDEIVCERFACDVPYEMLIFEGYSVVIENVPLLSEMPGMETAYNGGGGGVGVGVMGVVGIGVGVPVGPGGEI